MKATEPEIKITLHGGITVPRFAHTLGADIFSAANKQSARGLSNANAARRDQNGKQADRQAGGKLGRCLPSLRHRN